MKIEIEIADQAIQDLLTTALEGGSNYWYQINTLIPDFNPTRPYVDNLWDFLCSGRSASIHDCEDDTYLGELSLEKIKIGTALMITEHPKLVGDILSGEGDAGVADMWLQYVVMGEIVYG